VTRPTAHSPLRRAVAPAFVLALAGSLALAGTASAGVLAPENGPSPNANSIHSLYVLISLLGLAVFIAVEGMLFYSLAKYKAKKGRVAAQIHGNTKLEIGWTVGAAVILVFITAVTFIQLNGIKNPARSDFDSRGNPVASTGGSDGSGGVLFASTDQPAPPGGNALNIKVDGQQYLWRYQYPGPRRVYAYVDMVVPVGQTVTLDITSDDVAHSWWIPKLGGKMDAIPGYTNKTWFKATRPGVFEGQCAELCGRNHANMLANVRAVPPREYQQWYVRRAAEIQSAQDQAARQRAALIRSQGEQAAEGTGGGGSTQQRNPE
jgi:cytochrome c oxidase subunit II